MIEIDGSSGEGGGQILRTSLSLSCLLRKPFRIYNIRSGRRKPGLMPQHLTCLEAAAAISGARCTGASIGSQEVTFVPSALQPGTYRFDIGTAGSVSLLLQTILLPLSFCDRASSVTLRGGTHVPFSPPFDYLFEVFLPFLRGLGVEATAGISAYGFYPRGGGEIELTVSPTKGITAFSHTERGDLRRLLMISAVACLPASIAERQVEGAMAMFRPLGLVPQVKRLLVSSPGTGTFLFICSESANARAGFSALGRRGKMAEQVGREAAADLLDYLGTSSCLDPHAADQIVPYLAFADSESTCTTSRLTPHLLTNLWVTSLFTGNCYRVEGDEGAPGTFVVEGGGFPPRT